VSRSILDKSDKDAIYEEITEEDGLEMYEDDNPLTQSGMLQTNFVPKNNKSNLGSFAKIKQGESQEMMVEQLKPDSVLVEKRRFMSKSFNKLERTQAD
jgi:hypothetical protein